MERFNGYSEETLRELVRMNGGNPLGMSRARLIKFLLKDYKPSEAGRLIQEVLHVISESSTTQGHEESR